MKKDLNEVFILGCSVLLLSFLLFSSKECIFYASRGLLIWYQNMIPSLFPFMVLSGFMVRSGLSEKIGRLLQPLLGLFFPISPSMLYAIFMGFLCGFPMGAKIVVDLLEKKEITLKEGEYLLSFCNNIGPLYLLGYVVPLYGYETWKLLGLMYVVPIIYGFIFCPRKNMKTRQLTLIPNNKNKSIIVNYISCFQQALTSAIEQITILGGCMILFNCLQILPVFVQNNISTYTNSPTINLLSTITCCLIEIGGGLKSLASYSNNIPMQIIPIYLPLSLLTFGGLSCIMQTCFIIKNTELKITTYIKHKLIQSCIFIVLLYIS